MDRRFVPLHPDGLGVIAYGHHGRPLLAFPSEQGYSHDYESMG
ncbi:MAG: esterase, partial [Deltaproteobacteria bacterium]|nr:esterase [Deltaproteobacteria bacterium]